jgi:hypothetical protein
MHAMPPVDLTVRSSRLNVAVGLKVRPTARARNSRSETLPVVLHAPRTKGAAPPPKGGLRSNCVAGCATTVTVVLDNETTVVPYTNRNCLVLARHIERLAYTNLNLLVAQVQAQRRWREEVQERQKKSKNGDASSSPTSSPSSTRSHLLPPHHLPPRLRSLLRWNRRT